MGSNRITVSIWSNSYDEEGTVAPDYFRICTGLLQRPQGDGGDGVTPNGGRAGRPHGTKSSANMQYDGRGGKYHRPYAADYFTSATSTARAAI